MENTISIYKSFKNIEDSADSCSEPFSWKISRGKEHRTPKGQLGHLTPYASRTNTRRELGIQITPGYLGAQGVV